jgi:hypothetical protein
MNLLIYPLIFLLSFQAFAEDIVTSANTTSPSVLADTVNGTTLSMVTDSSADENDKTKPVEVFISFTRGSSDTDQTKASTLSTPTSMVDITDTTSSKIAFKLSVNLDTGSGNVFLRMGVAAGTDATSVTPVTTIKNLTAGITQSVTFDVSLSEICAQFDSGCSTLVGKTAGEGTATIIVYFYVDASATSGTVSDTSTTKGVFYRLNFSDVIPTGVLTITNVLKGDEQVTADFTGGDAISSITDDRLFQTLVFLHTDTSTLVTTNETLGDSTGTVKLQTAQRDGSITIKELENDQAVNISLALVNKFQFSTPLSISKIQTPISIEALLEKQACFLLTAGFSGEHLVVNYFRDFRDQFLSRFSLGNQFINWYYSWADDYARTIIHNEPVKKGIRFFAYGLYYVMNFWWQSLLAIFSLIFLTFFYYRVRKKRLSYV